MGNTTKPPANILELPMGERAEMALKAAFEKVVEAHIRDWRPISIWRDARWLRYPPRSCETRLPSRSDFQSNQIYVYFHAHSALFCSGAFKATGSTGR
jgi:hypothetical protein